MIEREKVTRGLEACQVEEDGCTTLCKANGCPYNASSTHCMTNLHKDALALLKEQEEGVTPIESTTEQKKFADRIGFAVSEYWCGDCHFNLFNRPKFCPNCGKKVKWDA